MSNTESNKKNTDYFTHIDEEKISHLRNNYKIINVDYLHPTLVHSKMFADDSFTSKKNIVNEMLEYYLNHNDRGIYKKTNYLCNEKEKICICNSHANDLRKIYDGINYKPNEKYISWFNSRL
jgi:hypothetical protein